MKYTKKLVSILLALTLVFAMAATAFAADETGSITVDNPVTGQTYTAYKIFDVTYNEDKTAYSYTIAADSEWLDVVKTYTGVTLSEVVTDAAGNQFYVVTKTNTFSAADFSAVLKENVTGKTGTELSLADGVATVSGLDLGYYFVTSSTGALCNLTTTNPDATIHDKNDVPFDKVDDDDSVELGQIVNYTITSKVPDTTGFTTYTFKITDTMSDGLTFNKDVKVYIGGTEITSACTITYTPSEDAATGYELTIPVINYQDRIGAEIEVKYSATVNENAVAQIENNKAQLEYTNDPDGSTTKTPEDIETVYSAKIVIDKYDANDATKKLAGAKFVLINNGTVDHGGDSDPNKGKFYKLVDGKVTWVDDIADATVVTTDENGAANFDGLENGNYLLREIEAPAGYNMLDEDVAITVDGANVTEADTSSLTVTEKVENNTGATLPETGGIGTTIFYVLGGLLVVGAVVLMVTKKRMGAEQ